MVGGRGVVGVDGVHLGVHRPDRVGVGADAPVAGPGAVDDAVVAPVAGQVGLAILAGRLGRRATGQHDGGGCHQSGAEAGQTADANGLDAGSCDGGDVHRELLGREAVVNG